MIIPIIIISIAIILCLFKLSFKIIKDSKGTKTYPVASSIGISFNITPLLIAYILAINVASIIEYAKITRQLSIS